MTILDALAVRDSLHIDLLCKFSPEVDVEADGRLGRELPVLLYSLVC